MYKFTKSIAGSNDGINILEYGKGDVIGDNALCDYLKENWLKSGVIVEYKEKAKEPEETETKEELIAKAKELLQAEEVDVDALKEIGKKLGIKKIDKAVNPDAIKAKVEDFIEKSENEE